MGQRRKELVLSGALECMRWIRNAFTEVLVESGRTMRNSPSREEKAIQAKGMAWTKAYV